MLSLVTAPTQEPVTIEEVKQHLRVDITDDDWYIESLIKGARQYCESFMKRAILTQTWDYQFDAWPANTIYLPWTPYLQSVTSVTYVDEDGNSATVSSSNYIVDLMNGRIVLTSTGEWPSVTLRAVAGVTVRYVAGWSDNDVVPQPIKHAMMLLIGDWYEQREHTVVGTVRMSMAYGIDALLWPYRTWMVKTA